jgi:hypothetical protein
MPEVPGGAAVDVVVALAFLLFVLSVVSAAVAELIANARNRRGRMLRRALDRLLGEETAARVYETWDVRVLSGPGGRLPSYLPERVFTRALREADPAHPALRDGVYDDFMDRVSGWYKRRVQWTVLAIALAGTIAINADPQAIGSRFVKDEAIKEAVTQVKPDAGVEVTAARVEALDELDLPFGWSDRMVPDDLGGWLGRALGWLILAISIPLGASFWFDLFSKVSRQRATGIQPTDVPDRDDTSGLEATPPGVPG